MASICRTLYEDDEVFPTCCSNPDLARVNYCDDDECYRTAFSFDNNDFHETKCQKCMKQLIYQRYGFYIDLSQIEWIMTDVEYDEDPENRDKYVSVMLFGQHQRYKLTFAETLRLFETRFNKIKSVK